MGASAESELQREAPAERRRRFAADVLGLDAVLELFAREALSSLGRRALAELAPRPAGEARAALARAGEALELARAGDLPSFAGVTDPLPEGRGTRAFDEVRLVELRGFFEASRRLREWFAERALERPALGTAAEGVPDLGALVEAIDATLDERGRVRDDASPLLARLRREAAELGRSVEREMRAVLHRPEVRAVLSDGAVHRRGGRPVLAVRAKGAGRVHGIVHDRSQSDQSVFVEPREVVALGNRLADLANEERRELDRLLLALSTRVLAERARIEVAALRVAEIEVALVAARVAAAQGARPALQPGDPGAAPGLLLREARHPLLLEQQRLGRLEEVVPIDLRLGAEFDMLIITGPNTGGKTLALKTAGLFALLTRCGLPVPAASGTTVPLYERVEADIGDEQEISQNLSTFASHLVRVRAALARADRGALVLLDELGGGTDPDEGAALGEAVLEHLVARGVPTIVSTHLGKLKEFAFRHARVENACTAFDLETLAPRYRLIVGTPGESGALVIARRLGVPSEVVDRAEERLARRDDELEGLMAEVQVARVAAERVRSDAERRLESAERTTRALEEQREELDRRGEQLEQEAQRGLEERVRDATRELERARAWLEQLPHEAARALGERLDALGAHLSGASLTERRRRFLAELKKGDFVYLPRYKKRVLVQRVDHARQRVGVRLGGMSMKVAFDEVTWYESL